MCSAGVNKAETDMSMQTHNQLNQYQAQLIFERQIVVAL